MNISNLTYLACRKFKIPLNNPTGHPNRAPLAPQRVSLWPIPRRSLHGQAQHRNDHGESDQKDRPLFRH